MQKTRWLRLTLVCILLFVLLGCGLSFGGQEDDEDELRLQLTVQALQMTQAAGSDKLAQANSDPPAAAAPQQSSSPESGSAQQQPSLDDSGTPCNVSKFVSESVPDGTNYNPGETFSKTWTLRNAGACKWNENYVFEYEEGTRMDGENSIRLNTVIEPNETVTFKVNLKAPAANGTYTGVWRLKSDTGEKLGKYWVVINVGGGAPPAGPFAVTSVKISTAAAPIDLICPDNVTVTAKITASAPGTVTYRWEDCEGGVKNGSVVFDAAGTKQVTHNVWITWSDPGHYAKLYIDNPNHQWFGPHFFDVVCNP